MHTHTNLSLSLFLPPPSQGRKKSVLGVSSREDLQKPAVERYDQRIWVARVRRQLLANENENANFPPRCGRAGCVSSARRIAILSLWPMLRVTARQRNRSDTNGMQRVSALCHVGNFWLFRFFFIHTYFKLNYFLFPILCLAKNLHDKQDTIDCTNCIGNCD